MAIYFNDEEDYITNHLDTSKFEKNLSKILNAKSTSNSDLKSEQTSTTTTSPIINKNINTTDPLIVHFILLSGSFNPPHKMHVTTFDICKKYLETKKGLNVVAGWIAPSSDSYVAGKLKEFAMPLVHRNALCSISVSESDWISVCEFGIASAANSIAKVDLILNNLSIVKTNNVKIVGIEICGADHAVKYSLWTNQNKRRICVPREPYTPTVKRGLSEFSKTGKVSGLMMVDEELSHDFKDVSSTAIREYLTDPTKDLNDLVKKGWLHQKVADYLKELGKDVFMLYKKKGKKENK